MNALAALLRRTAYRNVCDGVEWSKIEVYNFILTFIYEHSQFFPSPVFSADVKIWAVFYFLQEEDAKIDF